MKAEGLMISLKLDGRRCLVVGSGDEARARVETLHGAGADVTWLCPVGADAGAGPSPIAAEHRPFSDGDVRGVRLAVLTDRDAALAARMDAACRAENALFCAIDQPAHGDFAHVATARQGPLVLAVSTSGRAPALAKRIRQELERLFCTPAVSAFVAELEQLRARTPRCERAKVMNEAARRLCIEGHVAIDRRDAHSNSGNPESGSGAG